MTPTPETAVPDTSSPAAAPTAHSMRPVAVVFTLANALVLGTFVAMVAVGHVETGVVGMDLGIAATAAPATR